VLVGNVKQLELSIARNEGWVVQKFVELELIVAVVVTVMVMAIVKVMFELKQVLPSLFSCAALASIGRVHILIVLLEVTKQQAKISVEGFHSLDVTGIKASSKLEVLPNTDFSC